MIYLFSAAFLILMLAEIPKLIRNKQWRELIAYSSLMALAYLVGAAGILNINIPNPVRDSQFFIKSLLHLSYD
jgi:hypothetical protein